MNLYIAIILSLVFSAFFSGMEIAFVSSNKLRFELKKRSKSVASYVLSVFYAHPQQYITTMLVGNNICLVIFSICMTKWLTPALFFIQNKALLSLTQSIIATIIVLFVGEFLPKTIFRANSNLWLRIFSPILYAVYVVLYPIAIFCTRISMICLKLFGVKMPAETKEVSFSRVDLNYLIQESADTQNGENSLEPDVKIFQNALDFSNVKLRNCYIPRTEIVALPIDVELDVLKSTFTETGFSKIPIYKENIDEVIGYIHSSEMFEHQTNWREYINTIPIVPENMAAKKLMHLFMQQKKSIAVVVDEFGGTAGIITLEDIMEEIFGDIQDEHDSENYTIEKISNKEYLLSGRIEVETVNDKFGLHLPESDEYETIAGLILAFHGCFPQINELIRIEKYTFKCLKVSENRIELVKLLC